MVETAIVLADEVFGEDGEVELVTWLVEDEILVTENQPVAEVATAKAVVTVMPQRQVDYDRYAAQMSCSQQGSY